MCIRDRFEGEIVPVGEDQLPLIEQCKEIVRKFNSKMCIRDRGIAGYIISPVIDWVMNGILWLCAQIFGIGILF